MNNDYRPFDLHIARQPPGNTLNHNANSLQQHFEPILLNFCNFPRRLISILKNIKRIAKFKHALKIFPKWSLEASKACQEPPKRLPRRPKMSPKRFQETPKPVQDAPSSTQDAPKTSPRRPKCLQERPRSPQVALRTSQYSPKPLCSSIFGGFAPTNFNKNYRTWFRQF